MEVHSPDIYGPIELANSPGTAGQKLTSNGPAAQATWNTVAVLLAWVNNQLTVTVDGTPAAQIMNLISADANNLAVAGSDGRVYVNGATTANVYSFTSASNTTHTITHNLNNQFPSVTIYDQADGGIIQPATVVGTNANTLTITFFSARAIAGTVVG